MVKRNLLFYLNILALILSILWLIYNPDFEPLISTIGLTISIINFIEFDERPIAFISLHKNRNLIILLFFIISILMIIAFKFNNKSTIGIDGNNNSQNKIIISK